MIFEGSCNDDIASAFAQRLMEASDDELNHTASRFLWYIHLFIYLFIYSCH